MTTNFSFQKIASTSTICNFFQCGFLFVKILLLLLLKLEIHELFFVNRILFFTVSACRFSVSFSWWAFFSKVKLSRRFFLGRLLYPLLWLWLFSLIFLSVIKIKSFHNFFKLLFLYFLLFFYLLNLLFAFLLVCVIIEVNFSDWCKISWWLHLHL